LHGLEEDLELLRAAIAVALADGEMRRSEMGVIKGLAERTGVGQVSFEAMLKVAEQTPSFADNILIYAPDKARRAIEMLVAEAALDGNISPPERAIIERIAGQLKIAAVEFEDAWTAGTRLADTLRKRRYS